MDKDGLLKDKDLVLEKWEYFLLLGGEKIRVNYYKIWIIKNIIT